MPNKKKKTKKSTTELDSAYLLKIVLYLVVGAQWVRFIDVNSTWQIPIPVGLIVGVLFAAHEHFQMDRKIEYALLLIAAFVGFWSQIGLYVTL